MRSKVTGLDDDCTTALSSFITEIFPGLKKRTRIGSTKTMCVQNLYDGIVPCLPAELFTEVFKTETFRLERIVSHGHASPPGFWYDQQHHEWVFVLKGAATLQFEGDERAVELRPGDFVNIPAHKRHRVEWTTPDEPTVWLTVHYGASQ